MSEIHGQDEYIKTLKQIKEVEDKAQKEIDDIRAMVEKEMTVLDKDLKNAIATSNENGKKLVQDSIDNARKQAEIEATSIVNEAKDKSKAYSFKSDQKVIKELIQILFSKI
jgi:V/A-type H+/Na+-transporting ATPase subunit G/H